MNIVRTPGRQAPAAREPRDIRRWAARPALHVVATRSALEAAPPAQDSQLATRRPSGYLLLWCSCDEQQEMMCGSLPLLLVALAAALAAPAPTFQDDSEQIIVPQKRAALVLDRLLIALQKALHEDSQPQKEVSRDWPRTEPLRLHMDDIGDMRDHYEVVPLSSDFSEPAAASAPAASRLPHDGDIDTSGLQRRGQGGGRGRVLRCYFNAVTCF